MNTNLLLMEISRKLTEIETDLAKILNQMLSQPSSKTPAEWKEEKEKWEMKISTCDPIIPNPCPNWWSQNPLPEMPPEQQAEKLKKWSKEEAIRLIPY